MDVVAFARDRQLAAGIPLMDVQYALSAVDKELLEEDADDRLYHIPAISLSTPNDGSAPKINVIASECNSTPSSPPPVGSAAMTRRKSRDDSYLEEHHRQQNHFNSVHHHRFHHQYSTHYHSDSLDSAGDPLEPIERKATDSPREIENRPSDLLTLDQASTVGGLSVSCAGDGVPHAGSPIGDDCSSVNKSSFSLHSVHSVHYVPEPRGSLTVDKAALEDMRRCVSASKLTGCGSVSDSPNSYCCYQNTPSSGGSSGEGGGAAVGKSSEEVNYSRSSINSDRQRHPSSSSATNFFFGRDMDLYEADGVTASKSSAVPTFPKTEIAEESSEVNINCCQPLLRKSPEMHHHLSNVSIDSLSDISITCAGTSTTTATIGDGMTTSCYGGSQLSMNSVSTAQLLPYEEMVTATSSSFTPLNNYSTSSPSGPPLFSTENYRPLSRALMFSSEALLDENLILEEDEDALLDEEREAAEAKQRLLDSAAPATRAYQPPRDIPELKIWPNDPSDDDENEGEKVVADVNVELDSESQTEEVLNSTSFTDNFVSPSTPPSKPVDRPQDIAISERLPETTSEATTISSVESFPNPFEEQQQNQQSMTTEKTDQLAVQSAAMCSLSVNSLSSAPPSSPSPTVIPATVVDRTLQHDSTAAAATSAGSSISAAGSMNSFFNDNFEDILPSGDIQVVNNVTASKNKESEKNEDTFENSAKRVFSKGMPKCENKVKGRPPRLPRATHKRTIEMVKIVYKPPKQSKGSSTLNHSPFEFSLKKFEKLAFRNATVSNDVRMKRKKKDNRRKLMMRRRIQKSCCPECCACTGSDSATNSGQSVSTTSDPSTIESTEAEEEDELELTEAGSPIKAEEDDGHEHQYARARMNNHSLKYPLDDRAMHRKRTASLQQNVPANQHHQQHLQQENHEERPLRRNKRKMPLRRATITIHIAYECRIVPFGTAIKLKVTNQTLVAEIVETVVRYLHQMEKPLMAMTANLKTAFSMTEQDDEHQDFEDQGRLLKQKLKMLKRLNKEKTGDDVMDFSPERTPELSQMNLSRFSLLAVYASNIKHLNTNFPILNLQSPWNEAKYCLKYTGEEEEVE